MFLMNFAPNQQLKINSKGSLISTSAYRPVVVNDLKGSMKIRDLKSKLNKIPSK